MVSQTDVVGSCAPTDPRQRPRQRMDCLLRRLVLDVSSTGVRPHEATFRCLLPVRVRTTVDNPKAVRRPP
jgi:hypothetical protein